MNRRTEGIIRDVDVRQLKPYVQEWITAAINRAQFGSTVTGATGGTGGSGFTESDALALFYTQTQINTYRATHESNEDAHHPRSHPFLGTDHSYPVTAAGDVLWDPGTGLELSDLDHSFLVNITEDDHHNRLHGLESTSDHSFPAISDHLFGLGNPGTPDWYPFSDNVSVMDGTVGSIIKANNSGGFTATWAVFNGNGYVETPRVVTDNSHLVINPDTAAGFDIIWDGDADLVSDNHVSQESGILLRPSTGLIDTYKIQVQELYAAAFIVEAKRAENGAIIITPGVTQLTRPFTIPNAGSSGFMFVADYAGLPGYDVFQVNDDVRVFFMSESTVLQEPVILASSTGYDNGVDAGGVLFTTDFEGMSLGTNTGSDWKETGESNSTAVDDTRFFISDPPSAGTRALDSSGGGTNTHVHYQGTGSATLSDYRVTGSVYVDGNTWGITVGSAYTDGSPVDEYYRVRWYNAGTVHMDNHGNVGTGAGTTTSAFAPAQNTLYNFMIEFEDTGSQTEIRFKMWADGDAEPGTWLIDAYDNTAGRRTQGTFGFWGYNGNTQTWYVEDVTLETLVPASPEPPAVNIVPYSVADVDDVVLIQIVAECGDLTDIVKTGAPWTLINSVNVDGHVHALYYHRLNAYGGDGDWDVTLSGANYGALTYSTLTLRNVSTVSSPLESQNQASTVSGTSINIPADSGLTEGAGRYTFLAQHNITGAASISDSPNNWTQRLASLASNHQSVQIQYYLPGEGVTTTPSTNWTVSPARAYSAIYVALTPVPPIAGSFAMGSAYGRISAVNVITGLPAGEQCHQFTTKTNSPGQGVTAAIDAAVLNYKDYTGTNDPGVIELTTLDQAGSPYMQMGIRQEYNSTLGRIPLDVRLRIGKLDGIAGYGPDEWGLVVFGKDGVFDGEFAITNAQMKLDNVPFYQTDSVGDSTVDIVPQEGIVLYTGNNWANDYDRKLSFKDKDTLADVMALGSWDAGPQRYWIHEYTAGSVAPYGGAYHYVQQEVTGTGTAQRLQWRIALYQSNPYNYASITGKVADEVGVNEWDIQSDNVFIDAADTIELDAGTEIVFKGPNTNMGAEVKISEYSAGSGLYGTQLNVEEIRFRESTAGFAAGRSLQIANSAGELCVMRGWDSYNMHLRYMWFRGSFYASEGTFIASTNGDSSTNVDHMWHDDTGNRWHFVSDGTWKANGNSGVAMGTLQLKVNQLNGSLSGYGRVWTDGTNLKFTNTSGVTKNVQLV